MLQVLTPDYSFWEKRREKRVGVMLHYDQSSSDEGSLEWLLHDERARVSYNRITTRAGERAQVAPDDAAAWHAGRCKPSDEILPYKHANSAFYGVAISAHDEKLGEREHATKEQVEGVVLDCLDYFLAEDWSTPSVFVRIKGHSDEAWPRGRKRDPVGFDPHDPVLSVRSVQLQVFSRLFDLRLPAAPRRLERRPKEPLEIIDRIIAL